MSNTKDTKEHQLSYEQVEALQDILDIYSDDVENCITIEEFSEASEVDLTLLEKYLDISAAKKKLMLI